MNKGTRFYNCDFQVHTPRDINWSGPKPVSDVDRNAYAERFVLACREKSVNAVAITDHHDLAFFPYIKAAANNEVDNSGQPIIDSNKLVVFPGIELTLSNPPCQALLILDANFPEDQLLRVLHKLSIEPNPITEPSTIETVPISSEVVNGLKDLHSKLDSIDILKGKYIILPHTGRGHKGILRRDFYEYYKKMPCVSGYLDGAIPNDQGLKNIINGEDRNYGFKSIAVFQTSDNRKDTFEDLGTATTWVKWATPTAEALRQASLAKESRMSLIEPSLPQIFISKLSVTNSKFMGRVELELNQQYNAFIGGRGTGKSTLLEYLRWGLCDQILGIGKYETESEIQKRRQVLIDKTLVPFSGEVRITASVNGIEHIVKRNSVTKEIQLKIGNDDFEKVTEEEVRRLIPIQAYSQKQLSRVGVRTDELKRFIQQPITNELNNIAFNLREVSKNLKNAYSNLVRKKEIQSEIDELKLQHKSVGEQVQNLRKSLKGLTDEDKKIIENKELFENEQTFIQESNNEIDLFKQKFETLGESLSEYPSKIQEDANILNSEILSEIQKEKEQIFEQIKSRLAEILKLFSADKLAGYNDSIDKWKEIKKSFDASYGQIKEKASANESIIKEINQLEARLRELTDSINERISRIKELGNPETVFMEEKEKWYALHQNKIDLLNTQASNFTILSQGIIKAEVTRSINIEEIQELIVNSFTGTRISKDKIDNLCKKIKDSESPLESWKMALEELKSLAEYKILEDKPIELPETPLLTDIGLNETNIQRIVELFSPDKWLAMVTQEIEFEPHFFYSTGNEMQDVIPFSEASAGQQATALLSVLLNQEGNPLLIDQPEDDIDNRAINDIIENIWKAKNKRQLIFTSHNANLVVNGDAELVVCCDYKESSQQTQGEIKYEGAIDNPEIKKEITLIMEGGEKAFKLRKEKYGF
ncbi:TrlF family AAA-like ATPase [Flavobacterium sp. CS20]|uniref:TrlF family AAA-like ATPase n=1 Tax=Flavobacterium sp. CS20 TaxID=2775246 RepID=UPI001B3A4CA3|nr:AAA family ATPase [Flavobacterium sp. CS20]QTY27067.1 AAA family ATPase [Flavobacterium sp. CS20]